MRKLGGLKHVHIIVVLDSAQDTATGVLLVDRNAARGTLFGLLQPYLDAHGAENVQIWTNTRLLDLAQTYLTRDGQRGLDRSRVGARFDAAIEQSIGRGAIHRTGRGRRAQAERVVIHYLLLCASKRASGTS